MLERVIMNIKEVFGLRSHRAEVADTIDSQSQRGREAATDAINELLTALATTKDDKNGDRNGGSNH